MLLLHGFFEAFDHKNEACGCLYSFGFFLSCLQMTDSPLCDPEGCTIRQWSESAKTESCPALKEQTVHIQKHLSFKKQNAYIAEC